MSVRVETTERALTAFGGVELVRETARVLGVGEEIDACVTLKQRARGLSEGHFVLGMSEALATGAECLDDLAVARADLAQAQLRGHEIPAPQTAGAFLRRFTPGHICQLNKALGAVQRKAFELARADKVTLDFDSTLLESRSRRRQGVDKTYQKRLGLHPLLCFDAASGAAVHARLRRGKVNTKYGMDSFVTETLRRVPTGVTVRARLDSGFYARPLLEHFENKQVTYLCGVPLYAPILELCRNIANDYWAPCVDKDEGEVTEFGYRPRDTKHFRRYVIKRIPTEDHEQPTLQQGAYHYWVLVTNDHQSSPLALESEQRHRALVEIGIGELKTNYGLGTIRKHYFMANWVWLLLVCLAHNLVCWTQQLGQLGAGRAGTNLRAKRFRYRYLVVPAMIVRSARQLTIRVPHTWPYLQSYLAALTRLKRLRATAAA